MPGPLWTEYIAFTMAWKFGNDLSQATVVVIPFAVVVYSSVSYPLIFSVFPVGVNSAGPAFPVFAPSMFLKASAWA